MNALRCIVGELLLPHALMRAIDERRWKPPQDPKILKDVFDDDPEWTRFYNRREIEVNTQSFQLMSTEEATELLCTGLEGVEIAPRLTVLIGHLGADMPIALDYQLSRESPRVVYLGQAGWYEVASDFETLARLLNI